MLSICDGDDQEEYLLDPRFVIPKPVLLLASTFTVPLSRADSGLCGLKDMPASMILVFD